jgi:hypothetical protein
MSKPITFGVIVFMILFLPLTAKTISSNDIERKLSSNIFILNPI